MGRFNSPAVQEKKETVPQQMGIGVNQMLTPAAVREISTIQAQMIIAKSYPRDLVEVYNKVQNACGNNTLAKASTYAYAKGGTAITGPTIRLAEVLAKAYGNVKYGFEEVDSSGKDTKVRAYAFDMETNTVAERVFTVPHIRYAKGKTQELEDPREIYETIANNAQRRVRACILEIIPSDVVDYALEECTKTRTANIDKSPEKREAMLKAFRRYEVGKADIEQFIQRKFEAIEDNQWIRLQDIYQSLRDGVAKKEDFFKPLAVNPVETQDPEYGETDIPNTEINQTSSDAQPEEGPELFADSKEDEPEDF